MARGISHADPGCPWELAGFLDDRPEILSDSDLREMPVVGDPASYEPEEGEALLVAIGDPQVRSHYADQLHEKGAKFAVMVSPRAAVPYAFPGSPGVVVQPFAAISCDVRMGCHVSVGTHTTIGHDAEIGRCSSIGAHVFVGGGVAMGEQVTVFPGAVLLPGVRIGKKAIVGAGSVVTNDVGEGMTVFGNPARKVVV